MKLNCRRRIHWVRWFWIGGASVLFTTVFSNAAERMLTPQDIARLRNVNNAVISPDGTQIAYILNVPRDPYERKEGDAKFEDGPNWAELYVIRLSDGMSRPFVVGDVIVEAIQWTKDGKGISFLAKRGKDKHKSLYVISIEGGEARRILTHDTDISAYSWSPDGRRVAFLAERETSQERKDLKEKGFTEEVIEEDYQPVLVWVATPDDPSVKPTWIKLADSASAVDWSPAGDRLAVALAPTPLVDDEMMKRRVYIVDVERGALAARLDNPGKLGKFAWGPDGKHVAMLAAADENDPSDGRLMVGNVADMTLADVLPEFEGHVSAFAWQDDDTIMFIADEGLRTSFGKVNIDGTERKTVLSGDAAPILQDFSLSKDGQRGAFIANTALHPSEVFAMKHGETEPKRLTDSNSWLKEVRFAKQEAVTYKARDGLELQGVLIHPLEEKAGQTYPLILSVHGGPEAHERDGWLTNYSRPGQVAAGRGMAVFYPNYRGSTGRGVAFSKLGQGDEAGKEFDDLVDAIDHLAGSGLIDKGQVGITGGSYGGYAAAWGATALSDRFAASVMFVGISDTISKKGTTDIPNEDHLVHTRARLWDEGKWQFFLERSPIYHAPKCRTPTLILAGKNDARVHPSQSLELYRHLKTLELAPVRLVLYPGEGHGNRRAAAKLDYNIRMLQWLEHYLKGPGGGAPPWEIDYHFEKKAE